MRIRKVRTGKIIMRAVQGLLLLAVLSAMFSTIISLFMTSLMEGDFTADISKPDVSSEQASVSEGPAREDAGRAASEPLEADNTRTEEMLKTKKASMKPMAAVMWFALSLLFLMMTITLKHGWKYSQLLRNE